MYTIHLTNIFSATLAGEAETITEAVQVGRALGFEFTVQREGYVVAGWQVFGGLRFYDRAAEVCYRDGISDDDYLRREGLLGAALAPVREVR